MTVFAPILINLVHKVRNDQWLINRGRAKRRRKLEGRFPELAGQLHPQGGLWVCWPKKSAKVPSDLDGNIVRSIGLAGGLVDNKVCAVSEGWSGLRFVYRLQDRPGK